MSSLPAVFHSPAQTGGLDANFLPYGVRGINPPGGCDSAVRAAELAGRGRCVDYRMTSREPLARRPPPRSSIYAECSRISHIQSRGNHKALGGGWQLRQGNNYISPDIIKAMEIRTDWGELLNNLEQ